MACNGFVVEFKTHQLLRAPFRLLLSASLLSNEPARFVEFHKHTERGFNRRNFRTQFIAIERQSHFKAKRVAAAQSAGLHPGVNEQIPHLINSSVAGIDFKSIFSGVAGAAHDNGFAIVGECFKGVEHQIGGINAKHLLQHVFAIRPLHSELTVDIALVVHLHVEILSVLFNPRHIFVDVGSINHQEEMVVAHFVHQQIVDGATVFVEHHPVVDFTHRRIGDVVGEDIIHEFLGFGTRDVYFAHVRNVEHAHILAYGIVLLHDALILDRHVETAKRTH